MAQNPNEGFTSAQLKYKAPYFQGLFRGRKSILDTFRSNEYVK